MGAGGGKEWSWEPHFTALSSLDLLWAVLVPKEDTQGRCLWCRFQNEGLQGLYGRGTAATRCRCAWAGQMARSQPGPANNLMWQQRLPFLSPAVSSRLPKVSVASHLACKWQLAGCPSPTCPPGPVEPQQRDFTGRRATVTAGRQQADSAWQAPGFWGVLAFIAICDKGHRLFLGTGWNTLSQMDRRKVSLESGVWLQKCVKSDETIHFPCIPMSPLFSMSLVRVKLRHLCASNTVLCARSGPRH